MQHYAHVIMPKKYLHYKIALLEDISWNATVASNCIIVEIFFGRLTKIWAIISSKFRWGEEMYDVLFHLCMALTNYHISFQPLHNEEDAAD